MRWVKSQKHIWRMCEFRTEHTFPFLFFSNTKITTDIKSAAALRCIKAQLPLIPVPVVTPEGAFIWHLEGLNEEHIWTAMAANWFLYSWNIAITYTWDSDHICNTAYETRLEKIQHVTNECIYNKLSCVSVG